MKRNMPQRISFDARDLLVQNIAYKPGADYTDSHRLHKLTRVQNSVPCSSCLCLPALEPREYMHAGNLINQSYLTQHHWIVRVPVCIYSPVPMQAGKNRKDKEHHFEREQVYATGENLYNLQQIRCR